MTISRSSKVPVQISQNFHRTSEMMFSIKYKKMAERFSVSAEQWAFYCFDMMSHRVLTHFESVGTSTRRWVESKMILWFKRRNFTDNGQLKLQNHKRRHSLSKISQRFIPEEWRLLWFCSWIRILSGKLQPWVLFSYAARWPTLEYFLDFGFSINCIFGFSISDLIIHLRTT